MGVFGDGESAVEAGLGHGVWGEWIVCGWSLKGSLKRQNAAFRLPLAVQLYFNNSGRRIFSVCVAMMLLVRCLRRG